MSKRGRHKKTQQPTLSVRALHWRAFVLPIPGDLQEVLTPALQEDNEPISSEILAEMADLYIESLQGQTAAAFDEDMFHFMRAVVSLAKQRHPEAKIEAA